MVLEHRRHRLDRLQEILDRLEDRAPRARPPSSRRCTRRPGIGSQAPNTMSSSSASGTKSLISGDRFSVRLPRRIVAICVSEPIGLRLPRRMLSTPAMNVVATAPRPGRAGRRACPRPARSAGRLESPLGLSFHRRVGRSHPIHVYEALHYGDHRRHGEQRHDTEENQALGSCPKITVGIPVSTIRSAR